MNWRKIARMAAVICAVIVLAAFVILCEQSQMPDPVKVILYIVAVGDCAGIFVKLYQGIWKMKHEAAALVLGPDGAITIELGALRDVAQRSLQDLSEINVVRISPKVIMKKGTAFIDFKISISVDDIAGLARISGAIQIRVKQAVELFTGHVVRNVNVNFTRSSKSKEQEQKPLLKALIPGDDSEQ